VHGDSTTSCLADNSQHYNTEVLVIILHSAANKPTPSISWCVYVAKMYSL